MHTHPPGAIASGLSRALGTSASASSVAVVLPSSPGAKPRTFSPRLSAIMASEAKDDGTSNEGKAREMVHDEARRAAGTGFWPDGSSNDDLKFMLESVMALVERQNTTIRRLQQQVNDLWKENTTRGRSNAFDRSEKLVVVGFSQYVEAFSHDTGDWRELPSLPSARRDCAAASLGSKLFVVGGTDNRTGNVVDTLHIFDAETREWTEGPPMKQARAMADAISFNNGIVVVGGSDDDKPLATVEWYDPVANAWTMLPAMQHPREGCACVVDDAGRLVVCGGKATGAVALKDVEAIAPGGDHWTNMTPLSEPLGLCSAVNYNGDIIVAGNGQSHGGALNLPGAVLRFNGESWTTMNDRMTTSESSSLALEILNGQLVAVASEGAEEYDDVLDEWIALPQSRVRHFGCDAAVLPPSS